jgi:RimJ/RimL family protein N-acetyltransferase
MELQTDRLRLRAWRDTDLVPFARLNADARVMRYFPAPLTTDESNRLADRIRLHIDHDGWGLWAVEVVGVTSFAGFIGLAQPRFEAHFTPCTEVGWRLGTEFWGCGYATEGALAALGFGFCELGLSEVVSFAAEGNRSSRRVMERIGMGRSPADDFDHPGLPEGHELCRHVLYRKRSTAFPACLQLSRIVD